ncbi:AMP-binding protein [Virgisporangium aurantiacum]|uniref:Acyl-CoA synthetase n=1 Tax=Virgisporangium aurantiacum TaxID=175570 RepID=A0A8J3ZEZ6_9ACTN|nr:AMP-binding protein [Virgisporangium aurantiacum]GIJ62929.1 acyl-CoA synthetase [Virgisporangium aurantiacum]
MHNVLRRDPADTTITVDGETLTHADLYERAAALADRLTGAGPVAVVAHPTLQTVVAIVAGLHAGVPVVPVPPDSGPTELRHILTDSRATVLLDGGSSTDLPVPSAPATAGETALILYTSGTTGPPKGAELSAAAIAADLDALAEAWQWTPDDTLAHGLPLYHVHGLVLGVLGALRTGCRLVHTGRPVPARYAAAGATLYFGVPTVWSRVAADPACARALRPARLLVSGSAALPGPVFAALHALTGHRPVERYGMTETLITVSARADGPRRPGAVGTALPGVETRVAPEPGQAVGELQVRGRTLFNGYAHRADATRNAYTADGWFRTGDAATIDANGVHRILGRMKGDLIKSGGFRIGAGEVEDALLTHPAVREVAVLGRPDDDLGEEIIAFVVADPVTADALITHVATTLSKHKRPRKVVFLDALPRNHMGKIQKHRLL